MTQAVPAIEPEFVDKIAHNYASVYRAHGFEAAKDYLNRFVPRDAYDVREEIIAAIVKLGEQG